MLSGPARRTVLAGGASFAAGCAGAAPDVATPLEGRTLLSESVMLSGADAEGRRFAAVRACTYPDANLAWLWCMVLSPEGFWQFAANDIPWRGQSVAADPEAALYAVRGRKARAAFHRKGPRNAPAEAQLHAVFESNPALGEPGGPVRSGRVAVEGLFRPHGGFQGLLPGRSEAFGSVQFRCTMDGASFAFEGPAQFHEQPQTEPRFTSPFMYASLWSADVFATALKTAQGGGGYVIDNGAVRQMQNLEPSLSPADMHLDFALGGQARRVSLESVRDYRVPVYGRDWRGRFVRGRYGEQAVVGYLNTWKI